MSNASTPTLADCCSEPRLLPLEDALARMLDAVTPLADTESVALALSLDRILAEPVAAAIDVPAQDNSAMDGYALRAQDAGQPLRLIGTALAGHAFAGTVTAGTCVRIMTGAPVPAGADCVVMQENTQASGEQIEIRQLPRAGENIRRRGEDIARGRIVLAAGHRLGPVDIGLIASLGIAHLRVWRRVRVAILSTGDELAAPGQPLAEGQIYDSNRHAIAAMLQRMGADIIDLGVIRDDPAAIGTALQRAACDADAVISSGGVSVGDADYVKDTLARLGSVGFWKVAIKPGKPFAFGKLGNGRGGHAWFFGLPGNPVSSVVTLHQLALPVLRHLAGEIIAPLPLLQIPAGKHFKKQPGRADFQRAIVHSDAHGNQVVAHGSQGSGVLTSFTGANAFAMLETGRGPVEPGEMVTVIPFDRFLI
jgi:molybdopterin molybdotransferase